MIMTITVVILDRDNNDIDNGGDWTNWVTMKMMEVMPINDVLTDELKKKVM